MLYFPLWKKLLAASVLLFAVLQAVPNTLSPEQRSNLPAFMQKTINLGLDLQGGSHLVLEVDVEAVVVRAYQNLEDEVREVLRRNKVDNERVNYQDLRAVGAQRVSFNAFNEGQRAGLLKLLEKEIRNVLVEINETSGDVSLVFTPEYLEETRLFALNQTLEILRSRVDEFGVAEPLIQRQGERRVIIQLPGIDDVERAKNIIGRTAQLTFHLVEEGSTLSARKPGTAVYYEEYTDPVSGQINRIPYVLQVRPILTGEHLSRASSGFTQDTGEAAVFLTFDATGTRKFAKATTEHTGQVETAITELLMVLL